MANMVNCQFCDEEIREKATKCVHCGEHQHHELYESIKERSEKTKIIIQMAIGILLIIGIVIHAIWYSIASDFFIDFPKNNPLVIVAWALAYSAAIELAYMLFTPGPDEAVEPLIMGLASAILYSISRIDTNEIATIENLYRAVEIALYVFVLWGLFYIKKKFIDKKIKKNKVNNP